MTSRGNVHYVSYPAFIEGFMAYTLCYGNSEENGIVLW